MSKSLLRLLIASVVAGILVLGVMYAIVRGPDYRDQYRDVLIAFHLDTLPRDAFSRRDIVGHLDSLNRERCDKHAAWDLSRALLAARFRREAATLLTKYGNLCQPQPAFLSDAVEIFRMLGDYRAARQAADKLVSIDGSDMALLMRGTVLNAQKEYAAALRDFETIIRRSTAPSQLIGAVYVGAADARAALGEPCKAAELMATWIGYDPARRASSSARKQLAQYRQEGGNCKTEELPPVQRFPRRPNEVIRVKLTVNGQTGNFILDTGASYVSMTSAFARRAGISPTDGRPIKLHSANGVTTAMLAHADTVAVGNMSTRQVEVAVKERGEFAPGIDGLLGQSYLSRFQVVIHPDHWSIALR